MTATPLILASGSPVRRRLLTQAGLAFSVTPADLDETAIIAAQMAMGATPDRIARTLAEQKALAIDADPNTVVLGADQVLIQDGEIFQKPRDATGVRERLTRLRGRAHELICAVALVRSGAVVWGHTERASLLMRNFSDAFLETYTDRHGEDVTGSVGAYLLEAHGIQLFDRIDGDYFAILGLPMLPLMGALRRCGVLSE
ncbi:MAG: Maf family protein [Alphaproteobacteria bacterium]